MFLKHLRDHPRLDKGSILIVSIWALVFFVILGSAFYGIFSSRLSMAGFLRDRANVELLAYSACDWARQELRDETSEYDSLRKCAVVRKHDVGLGSFSYTLIDESRKLNINTASSEMLSHLPGIDGEIAKDLASPENRPYSFKEEILAVEGMTSEKYDAVKDLITVYGNGSVDINTASDVVLGAVGLNSDLIQKIILYRQGADGQEGNGDDGIFKDRHTILEVLESEYALTSGEKAQLVLLLGQQRLSVSSEYYTMDLSVSLLDKDKANYLIVIDNNFIKEWREK